MILSNSIKTLGLNKLKSIENGQIHFQTEQLCLHDTINWNLITNKTNSFFVAKTNIDYSKNNCGNLIYSIYFSFTHESFSPTQILLS